MEGLPLLTVNIQLPEPELVATLKKRCSKFGTVKFIRVLPIAKHNLHRFAFVQMSTLAETMDLAMATGGSTLGSGAVALCLTADSKKLARAEDIR
jgi:hypothetical protein